MRQQLVDRLWDERVGDVLGVHLHTLDRAVEPRGGSPLALIGLAGGLLGAGSRGLELYCCVAGGI